MAASRKSKHSPASAPVPVIYLSSSESDSDDSICSKGLAKRQRVESATKSKDKLLPDGFLDPLPHLKSSKSPKNSDYVGELALVSETLSHFLASSRRQSVSSRSDASLHLGFLPSLLSSSVSGIWNVVVEGFGNLIRSRRDRVSIIWVGAEGGERRQWSSILHVYGSKNKLEHDAKRWFLLKLLQDHNQPKWRKNDIWGKAAWDKISHAFNERFVDANVTKNQLRGELHKMRNTYKVLKQLSELNGLVWNHSNNMLQGPEDVWQKLLHTNKDAKKWYNTPWPYYSTCQELFGGQSINEKRSSDADNSEGVTSKLVKTSQKLIPLQELEEVDMTKFSTEFKKPKRKNDHCSEYTRLIYDETDFSIKTCMEAFYKLDGLTTADVFKVGRIFKSKDNREMFLSLIDEDREFWLRAEIDAD